MSVSTSVLTRSGGHLVTSLDFLRMGSHMLPKLRADKNLSVDFYHVMTSRHRLLLSNPHHQRGTDAPRNEWEAWIKENSGYSCGSWVSFTVMDRAMKYRCPRKVGISLKGVSHNLDQSEFDADAPLSVALSLYCAVVQHGEIIPADVLLKYGKEKEIIEPERTPRSFFNGRGTTFSIDVVYKDEERTEAELEAKWPISDEYLRFKGSDYLLSETEKPWFVTKKDGCGTYKKNCTRQYFCTTMTDAMNKATILLVVGWR
jgi:hypothetical protein